MLRTHTCGALRIGHVGDKVHLSGWVQKSRDLGGMTFLDLRDRYGVTQLVFNMEKDEALCNKARKLGREYVISVHGDVVERSNKNPNLATGEIEIIVNNLAVLNASNTPPFTIEDNTDGGDDLRMKYRYLDLRRGPVKRSIELRHRVLQETRKYLSESGFLEIETPVLIKSTPEGARDFVVPSRMNPHRFYALPQSPQTFKQLLMVSGFDKYFQIVRCFRDEDLRADRQPEFTQIDCEMSFVEQRDVLEAFEGLIGHILKHIRGVELPAIPVMTYEDAMSNFGSDKPDTRFEMTFVELNQATQGNGFKIFDDARLVVGICAKDCAEYSRKQLDALSDFVKRPQIGASGLVYLKYSADGTTKSSVDKFYNEQDRLEICRVMEARPGDLVLILSGDRDHTRKAMSELRLEMGTQLGLRNKEIFSPLWVVDFPLLEWDEDSQRYHAMHHPFTSPKPDDAHLLEKEPGKVRANAYDLVINGVELGGGSIRIHDRKMQERMFNALGFTQEAAEAQFGFLLKAFEYGAPPHGGIAFGFDRLVAMLGGSETIRDYIAFPKNNAGRDVMLDAPAEISKDQLDELAIQLKNIVNVQS